MPATHIRFDWAIKRLLRQKANFGILEGFLSELLGQDVEIREILESEGNKDDLYDKLNRVDILARLDGGELVIVEVQNEREHDYFHRMNFSQAKLVTQYLHEGNKYREVKRVISVNIVYFELGQGLDYVYEGHTDFRGIHAKDLLDLSGSQRKMFPGIGAVSDIFARYFLIKVNVFDDIARDTLDEWVYFLKNSEIKDSFRAKGLQEAKEKMRKDNLEDAEKIAYEQYVKEQRIKEAEIESALVDASLKAEQKYQKQIESITAEKEKERAEKEKERADKELAIARVEAAVRKLKSRGFTCREIADDMGLSEEDVERIVKP